MARNTAGVPAHNTAFVMVYDHDAVFKRIRVCLTPLSNRNWLIDEPAYLQIVVGKKIQKLERSLYLSHKALLKFKAAGCQYEVDTIADAVEELQKVT